MNIRAKLGSIIGDMWASKKMFAIWPWPATIIGTKGGAGELFTAMDYRFFTAILQPGDFILTRSKGFFGSNSAIPGSFKHLAVYVGSTRGGSEDTYILKPRWMGVNRRHTGDGANTIHERTIVHAISEGVVAQDLYTLTKHIDYACIVRCSKNELDQRAICKAALNRVGVEYNFDFTPEGPPASYCTELGQHCLKIACLPIVPTTKTIIGLFKSIELPLADDFIEGYGAEGCTVSAATPSFARLSHRPETIRKVMSVVPDYRDFLSGE